MPSTEGGSRRRRAPASWPRPRPAARSPALSPRVPCRTRQTRGRGRARGCGAPKRRSLFGFVLLIFIVLGVDRERFLAGLHLVERLLGDGRLRLLDLFGLLVVHVVPVTEEGPAHVGALLRLGDAVVAGERDAARVLGALEHLADGDTRVLRIGAHDRRDVLIAGADQIDEPPSDLRLEEPDEIAVARVDREEPFLLAQVKLGARAELGEDVGRRRARTGGERRLGWARRSVTALPVTRMLGARTGANPDTSGPGNAGAAAGFTAAVALGWRQTPPALAGADYEGAVPAPAGFVL